MGLFSKKESVSRDEVRNKFHRDRGLVRGTDGVRKYNYAQRDKIARETLGVKHGENISKDDYQKVIRRLEGERRRTSQDQKKEIDDKIKYIKKIGRGF
ncbi:hypothetical protein KKA24_01310 [Patescibacteria group bacterium]|nr:hypothetical protein [Patescibacteria group bacterium]